MGEAAKKDDEEKLIPVGPGADDVQETDKKEVEPEDKRLAQKDDEEPAEPPKAGEHRKETSKERRERAKKSAARDRLERDFLLKRNEELEKRFLAIETRQSQTEVAGIDQRVNTIKAQIANADRVMADAMRKPNGGGADEFIEAQRIRDELRDQLMQLNTSKATHERHASERVQQSTREADTGKPDPRVLRNARDWASKHDWFAFDGEDEDSTIVRAIDVAVAAEGFDPSTQEYWDELTERVKRRLPEKFKKGAKARPDDEDDMDDDDDGREVRSAGPKFSSGGRERPLKKGEVYVSAERKQAMKEYGVWDDPTARNRMLKKYAQWDAEMASSKR